MYLVSGILFNKLYRKESGSNIVPNVTLWGAMPGLVKVGEPRREETCFGVSDTNRAVQQLKMARVSNFRF